MTNLSLFIRILPVLMTACLFTGISCRSENKGLTAETIDSLIILVDEIQARIGSPEVQRLNELYEEIQGGFIRLSGSGFDTIINMQIILSYRQLDKGLNSCIRSCNRFHEEAFMIETSLREISTLLEKRQGNPDEIETRLKNETELLKDLRRRVDSTRLSTGLHVSNYHLLKPRIDSLITLSGSPAGNYE